MSNKSFSVAIIGGGIAGVALGIGLARHGIKFHIYERQPSFEEYSAGLGIQSNGVQALAMLDPRLPPLLDQIVSHHKKLDTDIEMFDGRQFPNQPGVTLPWDHGTGGMCLRQQLLDMLIGLLPADATSFNKRFERVEENGPDGRLRVFFADGTDVSADVVAGCDGLGSRVRRTIVGSDHPSARVGYTHRYCYRALIPMQEARAALGGSVDDSFLTKQLGLCNDRAYILQFPVANGQVLNLNAISERPEAEPWADEHHTLVQVTKEEVLQEFQTSGFSPVVRRLVECLRPEIGRWALFDLYDHPVPTYSKGGLCIVGDAGHAATPHLGIGASVGLCDAAVLTELLAYDRVQDRAGIEAALKAYSQVRLPRGHEVVKLSRENGSALMFQDAKLGKDLEQIRDGYIARQTKIKGDDLEQGASEGKRLIDEMLSEL